MHANRRLEVIGLCKGCEYFEYADSKYSMNGAIWHWGHCYIKIPKGEIHIDDLSDLSEYFEVEENHYCAKFKRKEFNEEQSEND